MAMIDLETGLSDEERTIQDTVHKFAAEVMRPAGEKLDALADPGDVIAKDSILWDVFDKHRELGLDDATDPARAAEQGLTPMQQARLRCIISEEMGWETPVWRSASVSTAFRGCWRRFRKSPSSSSASVAPTCTVAGRSPSRTTAAT